MLTNSYQINSAFTHIFKPTSTYKITTRNQQKKLRIAKKNIFASPSVAQDSQHIRQHMPENQRDTASPGAPQPP
jgi:hypothetical protein